MSDRALRALIGPSCYVECALAALRIWRTGTGRASCAHGAVAEPSGERIWQHDILERWALRGEAFSSTADLGELWQLAGETNLFRTMLEDRVPDEGTVYKMETHLRAGQANVRQWRQAPLWDLLMKSANHAKVLAALYSMRGPHRDCLFDEVTRRPGQPALRYDDVAITDDLCALGDLDALVALVALAREAMLSRFHRMQRQSAIGAWRIFPKVVAQVPHLYIRWRDLAALFVQRVWKPPPPEFGRVLWFAQPLDTLEREVAHYAKQSSAPLPPERLVTVPRDWPVAPAQGSDVVTAAEAQTYANGIGPEFAGGLVD